MSVIAITTKNKFSWKKRYILLFIELFLYTWKI